MDYVPSPSFYFLPPGRVGILTLYLKRRELRAGHAKGVCVRLSALGALVNEQRQREKMLSETENIEKKLLRGSVCSAKMASAPPR